MSDSALLDGYERIVRECRGLVGVFLATQDGQLVAGAIPFDIDVMEQHGLSAIGSPEPNIRCVLQSLIEKHMGLATARMQ